MPPEPSFWESPAFAGVNGALALLSLVAALWGGHLLARRLLLARGPQSVRRMLMAQLGAASAESYLFLLAGLLRVALLALALRVAYGFLAINPVTAAHMLHVKLVTDRLSKSPAVIVVFDILVILAATWILLKLLRGVGRLFSRIHMSVPVMAKGGSGVRFRIASPATVRRMSGLIKWLVWLGRMAVSLALVLVYTVAVFSLFPVTREWVGAAYEALLGALGGIGESVLHYLPNLANLLAIALVTKLVLKFMKFMADEVRRGAVEIPGFYPEWATPTYQLVQVLTLTLALVVAFPFLPGSDSPIFHGMSVFFGVLISLGSTSFVANVVAGVVLTYTRGFRIGDRVRIADTQGDVVEKGLLVTRVRTIKNVEVTIPNSLVMSSHMVNYSTVSRDRHLILCTTVTLSYDLPWRMVHETLVKAALATPGILAHPRPFVMQTSLNDYHVSYELNAYTDNPNAMQMLYSELHQSMQDACNAAGFEILSPGYTAVRDGNGSTLPAAHRPAGHADPVFRVEVRPPAKPDAPAP